ncbi:UvrD-helicase domain-containing protein [Micrococcus sp. FDAARGOS_333]|uniref:HelD family protein n=1 Tax=Micrococcus sp. FDAARGOS_333 TaxID=1930558 RepID=UPI000B4E7268|nr:UvrD-helicase domain-containing protein [Micrococcus sp. FDAARGOS_333]PNL18227.1 AAA family ATPase [Micrococcus sp. FDAARGOS_333]
MGDTVTVREAELALERERVAVRYARLDALRAEKQEQLAGVRRSGLQGSVQNHSERDAFAALYEDRLAQLEAVEDRLVFGRLDLDAEHGADTPGPRYIGRIGLTDEEHERLLLDWRAQEAGAFYQATPLQRQGVRRRRHLMLRGRTVRDIEDEVLDPELASAGTNEIAVGGQGALLAAVTARRTGRMHDIVATIQSEQDELIRRPLPGAVVVQGGPGTGKTAVALHRAAYLLYTHRERLAKAGVLLVGPSVGFLRYIERVLPSLGETGVVMASLGTLYPGVAAVPETDPRVAVLKGRIEAAEMVQAAVARRQRLIPARRTVAVDGTALTLSPGMVRRARERARATRKPHNEARETFVKILVRELADQLREKLEHSAGATVNRDYLLEDVRTSRDVRIALNLCWMPMTPQRLLAEVFSTPETLRACAPWLGDDEARLLLRAPDAPWTEADVPLLDEAAELLGAMPSGAPAEDGEAQHRRNVENAKATLENVHQTLADLGVDGVVDAETLARANERGTVRRTTAEQARHDRTWTYGHVVVDEAQELSPMQWRLLARRCPMKSFTIVGDIAQASAPGAPRTWRQALGDSFDERLVVEELSVNYRTPSRIVRWAAGVARAAGVKVTAPEAVREGDHEPTLTVVPAGELQQAVLARLAELRDLVPEGLSALVVPEELVAPLSAAMQQQGLTVDRVPAPGVDVVVATARETKGLEFDVVVLASPERLVADAHGVVGDLYVAMTRCTQALAVVTDAPEADLPGGLVR